MDQFAGSRRPLLAFARGGLFAFNPIFCFVFLRLSLIPAIGVMALIAGGVLAFRHPSRVLWWCGLSFLVSELSQLLAYPFTGEVSSQAVGSVLLAFLGVQLLVTGFATYRARTRLAAAVLFAVFSLIFALFTSFIGGMSLTGTWI